MDHSGQRPFGVKAKCSQPSAKRCVTIEQIDRKRRRYAGDRMIGQTGSNPHDMAAALLFHPGDGELRDVKESGEVDARIAALYGQASPP